MRRPSKDLPPKPSLDSTRLMTLSQALSEAASRLEQAPIQATLDQFVLRQLKAKNDDLLENTLNHLFSNDFNSYDGLMEAIETQSSSALLAPEKSGAPAFRAQLIAAPILAWTRYEIAAAPLPGALLKTLSAQFSEHFLLPDARLCLAPRLYSIDQLPQGFSATLALTEKLAQAAHSGTAVRIAAKTPETVPFLADVRFVLGVVLLPEGSALFRWQSPNALLDYEAARNAALSSWQETLQNLLGASVLTGCGLEALLPQAYFVACREADRCIRPVSIQAAVHYLTQHLSLRPDQLQAVIAGFGSEEAPLAEYRISLAPRQEDEVFYGVLWPLYGPEDEETSEANLLPHSGYPRSAEKAAPLEQIKALLEAAGVRQIVVHSEGFAPEFCDDCGTPLYPNAQGELMHPEMPETSDGQSRHLH